jgi:hypothetical protein
MHCLALPLRNERNNVPDAKVFEETRKRLITNGGAQPSSMISITWRACSAVTGALPFSRT